MAKKSTIDLENAEPLRDLPSSGVQVNYKHQTIIASDETSEYALLTANKICEANIGVVYIKPETEPVTIPVYMQIGDNDPVYHSDLTALPGSEFANAEYSTPSGAMAFDTCEWGNDDDAYIILSSTLSGVKLLGYMPIPTGEHDRIVLHWRPDDR